MINSCRDNSIIQSLFKTTTILISLLGECNGQNWWNFEDQINPYKIPDFTPIPNQRFTHNSEIEQFGPMANDVIVNIPKAGMGTFIGYSAHVDYEFTWTQWPPVTGRLVNVFLGVPYAAPPVGDQRFRQPVPAYLDTRYPWYAKSYRSACMQSAQRCNTLLQGVETFSEDCLYLNLFYPNRTWEDPNTRYPVVIHIHGGSFVCGSSCSYPGHALASTGLVVVTINYRLGPFGFLSTGDAASPGNYGLWDQLLAFNWVKENIEWFSGDPTRITVMGESAGAASVGLHVVSPASRERDLFHQAIMMSGSDLSPWAVVDPNRIRSRYYAIELGRKLSCQAVAGADVTVSQSEMSDDRFWRLLDSRRFGDADEAVISRRLNASYVAVVDAHSLVACLRHRVTADEIQIADFEVDHLHGAPSTLWTPVVDGMAGFLPRMPVYERSQGRFARIPLLSGVVHDEGANFMMQHRAHVTQECFSPEQCSDLIKEPITKYLNEQNTFRLNRTAEEVFHRYSWWPNLMNATARWESMIGLLSDFQINAPVSAVTKYHAAYSNQTYFYEFSYLSPLYPEETRKYGVYHGAEMPYLWGVPFTNASFWKDLYGEGKTPRYALLNISYPHDTNMSDFILQLWSNFIKYANPTPVPVKNVTWRPFRQPEEAYLHIMVNSTLEFHFRSQHMAFWNERFFQLAEVIPSSPPLYYFLVDFSTRNTIIMAVLLVLALVAMVILLVLLTRRPDPDQFRRSVRLAAPAAAPGSAFHSAFQDAFASREHPAPIVDWAEHQQMLASGDLHQLEEVGRRDSGDEYLSSNFDGAATRQVRRHPTPPLPPTSDTGDTGVLNRRRKPIPEEWTLNTSRLLPSLRVGTDGFSTDV